MYSGNYVIALFKDNKHKKVIKSFVRKKAALKHFDKLMQKSDKVLFEKKFETSWPCKYELCIVQKKTGKEDILYFKDEMGRNIKAVLDDEQYCFLKVAPYRKEEKIFDIQQDKRITVQEFIDNYLSKNAINMISGLNHKIIVQNYEEIYLFSLKTMSESKRFLDFIQEYSMNEKNMINLIVKDISIAQRSYLYDLLVKNGYDKKALYKQYTNYPGSK